MVAVLVAGFAVVLLVAGWSCALALNDAKEINASNAEASLRALTVDVVVMISSLFMFATSAARPHRHVRHLPHVRHPRQSWKHHAKRWREPPDR